MSEMTFDKMVAINYLEFDKFLGSIYPLYQKSFLQKRENDFVEIEYSTRWNDKSSKWILTWRFPDSENRFTHRYTTSSAFGKWWNEIDASADSLDDYDSDEADGLCVLCKNDINDPYGHNPAPLKDKGRCCEPCNTTLVVPMRVFLAMNYE